MNQPYNLGPYFCANPHHALLHHALTEESYPLHSFGGQRVALEFGVGDGASTRCIAQRWPTIGFDWFYGLPEDWRPGFELGMFACEPPEIDNVTLVRGLFEDTLPEYSWEGLRDVALVHIDCDLYSSTKTVLKWLPWQHLIRSKSIILFDEWWGYPEAAEHEQKAWREFADKSEIQWEVIGHGVQQWAIRLV